LTAASCPKKDFYTPNRATFVLRTQISRPKKVGKKGGKKGGKVSSKKAAKKFIPEPVLLLS